MFVQDSYTHADENDPAKDLGAFPHHGAECTAQHDSQRNHHKGAQADDRGHHTDGGIHKGQADADRERINTGG